MTAERLAELFSAARSAGRTLLLPYLTAGLPDPEASVHLFEAMAEAGADGFEVGIPYSDPLMDGPVIQRAASQAIASGIGLSESMAVTSAVAERTGRPVLVMTYSNPVLRVGPSEFARRVADAGGSGLIVADLPAEEAAQVMSGARRAGIGTALFVAPTSKDSRLRKVAALEPAFIYGVADLGVTGERREPTGRALELARRVRAVTHLPLVMGVGISTPEQAAGLAGEVDGIIVGSVLVRRVLEATTATAAAAAVGEMVGRLAAALR